METDAGTVGCDHWLLMGVAPESRDRLLALAQDVRFEPGQVIFREGEVANGLYLIGAGSVRLSTTGDLGETLLSVAHAGEIVGELGVLDGQPRSATAVALGVCAAHFLPAEPFLDALESSALVCMKMIVHLTRRLRAANGRLGEVAATSAVPREQSVTGTWSRRP